MREASRQVSRREILEAFSKGEGGAESHKSETNVPAEIYKRPRAAGDGSRDFRSASQKTLPVLYSFSRHCVWANRRPPLGSCTPSHTDAASVALLVLACQKEGSDEPPPAC